MTRQRHRHLPGRAGPSPRREMTRPGLSSSSAAERRSRGTDALSLLRISACAGCVPSRRCHGIVRVRPQLCVTSGKMRAFQEAGLEKKLFQWLIAVFPNNQSKGTCDEQCRTKRQVGQWGDIPNGCRRTTRACFAQKRKHIFSHCLCLRGKGKWEEKVFLFLNSGLTLLDNEAILYR